MYLMDGHSLTVASHRQDPRRRSQLAWLPIFAFALLVVVLSLVDVPVAPRSRTLVPMLNAMVFGSLSLIVAYLAARGYVGGGCRSVLLLGCGSLTAGLACLASAHILYTNHPNVAATTHNVGGLLGSLFHLLAAVEIWLSGMGFHIPRFRRLWLVVLYAVPPLLVAGIIAVTWNGLIPPFIKPARLNMPRGSTDLRISVLILTTLVYLAAGLVFGLRWRRTGASFLRWYSLGLGLMMVGVLGMTVGAFGSPAAWAGLVAQSFGQGYILVCLLAALGDSNDGRSSAGDRIGASFRLAELEYRAILEAAHEGIWMIDARGFTTFANARMAEMLGYAPGEMLGRDCFETVFPEDMPEVRGHLMEVLRGNRGVFELRLRRQDGSTAWVILSNSALYDEEGRLAGVLGMFTDITERKRAEDAVAAAAVAAQAANDAKDRFLAVLSHELRTPLTPVLAIASMMEEDKSLPERYREDLHMIHRNVDLEARLIDDLLDVTRIGRGKVELDKRPVQLTEVIREALEVCKPDIEARRLNLRTEMGEASQCVVEADAARLQQVFWNLLKNAVKFTPPGGDISVRVRREGGQKAIVEVADNGQGIAPEAQERIFDAFEQAEHSIARQFGGLGLGLTISRALVELHGGTIEAQSAGQGKGATFRVILPVTSIQSPAAELRIASPEAGNPKPQARSLRILLVEDHCDTLLIISRVLRHRGHEVATAGDVATALEMATSQAFDLLVSDLGLPDGSGLELIRELRARGQTIPAIALSGYGQEEDIKRSREAGFSEHLTKPVDWEHLHRIIASVAA